MKKTILLFAILACNLLSFSQTPALTITQPTCASPFGSVQVSSPLSSTGTVASNLYISEVTDANLSGLSYIEIYNGTGATVNLVNYKLKTFLNGSTSASCDLPLSGTLQTSNVFIVAVGSSTNLGGVTPNQTFVACAGFNTNDAVMLTTSSNVAIDLWGDTNGTVFTPQGQPGYTYRRHINAAVPSLTWNPNDWDVLDPEDYSNVGSYSTVINYQYSLDGGAFQTSPFFGQILPGTHTITAKNMATSATAQTPFDIHSAPVETTPTIYFAYPTPLCQLSFFSISPVLSSNFTTGGTFTSVPAGLIINPSTGVIDINASNIGNYTITYTVPFNPALCMLGGMSSFNFTINAPTVPVTNFSYTSPVYQNCNAVIVPIPLPNFTYGGTFTATPNSLSINPTTGAIDTNSSSAGIYSITYHVAANPATCTAGGMSDFALTILPPSLPFTDFSYQTPVCQNSNFVLVPQTFPDFTYGGTFMSPIGLYVNPVTGEIQTNNSLPGTYVVTYNVAPNSATCSAGGMYSTVLTILPQSTMPQGAADQTLTMANATLANVDVLPSNVVWYSSLSNASAATNALPANTPLVDGALYYAVNTAGNCPSDPLAVTVHINLSSSSFADFTLKIMPNPATTSLSIQTPTHLTIDKITISDLSGKTIITQIPMANNQCNIEQLAAGMYLIDVYSGEQKCQAKFIKQ
ncbi:MAG: hypothetical protein CFE24_05115 [Flavobacterium sp. BFFFF2]|nr:MAG: hypothetical protein CFE24_05115 [Flavobacterium sp. BFFFF2]